MIFGPYDKARGRDDELRREARPQRGRHEPAEAERDPDTGEREIPLPDGSTTQDRRHVDRRGQDRIIHDLVEEVARLKMERAGDIAGQIDRLKNTPLTLKGVGVLLGLFLLVNQAINLWRANNVAPEALQQTNDRVEHLASSVDSLRSVVQGLTGELREKRAGDNFFYYSLCYSWRQKFPTQYPAFCDKPEIQQFDPLGHPIPPPR